MKTRIWSACLACIVVGLILSGLSKNESSGQVKEEKPVRTKWEYKVQTNLTDEQWNKLGQEGWELVAATERPTGGGQITRCYFKRPAPLVNPPAPNPDGKS
jgi:hypothetical protein